MSNFSIQFIHLATQVSASFTLSNVLAAQKKLARFMVSIKLGDHQRTKWMKQTLHRRTWLLCIIFCSMIFFPSSSPIYTFPSYPPPIELSSLGCVSVSWICRRIPRYVFELLNDTLHFFESLYGEDTKCGLKSYEVVSLFLFPFF